MSKQVIVILEGVDGCGKTAVKKLIEKKSNWEYIIIDRFTGSDYVYDKIYNRECRDVKLLMLESDMNSIAEVYLIYLECDDNVLLERLKIKKEDKKIISKIKLAKTLFNDYIDMTYFSNFLKVNTTKLTAEDTANKIIKFIRNGGDLKNE